MRRSRPWTQRSSPRIESRGPIGSLTRGPRPGMFCGPMPYDPKEIEPKWQSYWLENETFRAEMNPEKIGEYS